MHKAYYAIYGVALAGGAVLLAAGGSQAIAASFGFGITSEASAKDVGLPFYPGARLHKDKDDAGAANMWGAFGSHGMKLVAVELDTNDVPPKVVQFYTAALAKYGPVLDCSYGKPRPPRADKNSNKLDCGDDHAKPGEFVFKAGWKREFRVVGIEPQGRGSRIGLVFIQMRGFD